MGSRWGWLVGGWVAGVHGLVVGWVGVWMGRCMGGWSRSRTGVIETKGWVGEWLVGGVHGWVVWWVGVWVCGMGGCVGGWDMGSHTSLDQPCLGTDMTGAGELNTPLPPIQPFQAHLCHFSACTRWYIKSREHMALT